MKRWTIGLLMLALVVLIVQPAVAGWGWDWGAVRDRFEQHRQQFMDRFGDHDDSTTDDGTTDDGTATDGDCDARQAAREQRRQEILAKIEEWKAAREAEREARREAFIDKYDTDGDGEVSRDELMEGRKQAIQERIAAWMAEYDLDGDGVLSDEEKQAAREKFQQRQAELRQRIIDRFRNRFHWFRPPQDPPEDPPTES